MKTKRIPIEHTYPEWNVPMRAMKEHLDGSFTPAFPASPYDPFSTSPVVAYIVPDEDTPTIAALKRLGETGKGSE